MEFFQKAVPIWAKGMEHEMHTRLQFKAIYEKQEEESCILRLSTSGIYHLQVNGKFVSYGPARTGKGHFCVEELDISQWSKVGKNIIVVEVCGYYATSFYVQKQTSFLIAELLVDDEPMLWTGEHFSARFNPEYIQKTQRYSYQRPMVEAYKIVDDDTYAIDETEGSLNVSEVQGGVYIERKAPYPRFEKLICEEIESGVIEEQKVEEPYRGRSIITVDEALSGFLMDELEILTTDDYQKMKFIPREGLCQGELSTNSYALYRYPYNASGMVTLRVECKSKVTMYVMFDEVLTDGEVKFLRNACANIVKYELPEGSYNLQFFEVYTMKYVQVAVTEGECAISDFGIIEYKHPPVAYDTSCFITEFRKIADAAIETFRQNSVDVLTDCPSRERAGWLCDSFFTARAEQCLTGENVVERCFLEAFLCEEDYDGIPEGMLPMCYPADHLRGEFIPNWSLWMIIELEDYQRRTGDREFPQRFKNKIDRLLGYFAKYENEDGLLENLDGWVFVEWSKANDLVQDVNYPSNMLYYSALQSAGRLFERLDFIKKAEKIKEKIVEQSFNGEFFLDNSVRNNGLLQVTGECTEVCQYYAFFFGIATKEEYPELYKRLMEEFGPHRDKEVTYPHVYPANAFIGNYLRLDILMQNEEYERVQEDIEGYFGYMAERTGTLWEHTGSVASCNHGFASYVICWLDKLKTKNNG